MKGEYKKILDNNSTKTARIVTKKLNEKEYEIVEMDIHTEFNFEETGYELLREVTFDADREGITLCVDINKIMNHVSK